MTVRVLASIYTMNRWIPDSLCVQVGKASGKGGVGCYWREDWEATVPFAKSRAKLSADTGALKR